MSRWLVSVLIITRDREFVLGSCLDAVRRQIRRPDEVVVVDSSPGEATATLIQRYPEVTSYRISLPPGTRPQSYSYGVAKCRGDIVAFLDDDSVPAPQWLGELLPPYANPTVGAVGGRVLSENPEGRPKASVPRTDVGRVLPEGRVQNSCEYDGPEPFEVDTVRGCNMSARRTLIERVGFFDPHIGGPARVEDDLCLRIKRAGSRVMFTPRAVVRHLAARRPDIPRSSHDARSTFHIARNTVYFFFKNCRPQPQLCLALFLVRPLTISARFLLAGLRTRTAGYGSLGQRLALAGAWIAGTAAGAWLTVRTTPVRWREPLPRLRFVNGRWVT